jgi:hypothetical protein
MHTRLTIIAVIALLSLPLIGCSENSIYTSESLGNVALSSEVDEQLQPVNSQTVFDKDTQIIYCSFTPSKAPIGANIMAQWIYVQGEINGVNNYVIDQWTEPKKNQGRMAMLIRRPTNGWPKGDYRVVLFVNDREELRIPFSIK